MNDRVVTKILGNVATVMLNRAAKRNAVDLEMFSALTDSARRISQNSAVRAVVLHGDGGHFCAGIDISVFASNDNREKLKQRMQPQAGTDSNFFQSAAMVWRDLPVPVIAALDGAAFGAGLQIAMGADIRYGGPDLQLSVMEVMWGIIPDMGLTVTMPGVVAQDKLRQMAYTGQIVGADAALEMGFITEISDQPLAAAKALAAEIANKSPDAIRAIKALINESWSADRATALRHEAELQSAVMAGDNVREAARARQENRTAEFDNPA